MDLLTYSELTVLLLSLVYFQVKHFVADYLLQGEYMLQKFKPNWEFFLPLLAHVSVHGAGTLLYLLAMRVGHEFYWLVLADMVIHFTMDRLKAGPKYMGRWKPLSAKDMKASKYYLTLPGHDREKKQARKKLRENKYFWWSLGFDQMVHHLTHYGVIFYVMANI